MYIHQRGYDGVELADAWYDVVTMTIPLIMMPQSTAAAIETLMNSLNTELARPNNGIEYLGDELSGSSWILDTFASDKVSVHHGEQIRAPWKKREGMLFELHIDRQPVMRVRGTLI